MGSGSVQGPAAAKTFLTNAAALDNENLSAAELGSSLRLTLGWRRRSKGPRPRSMLNAGSGQPTRSWRSSSDNPPHTPYCSPARSAYSLHRSITGQT